MIFAFDLDNTLCEPINSGKNCKDMLKLKPYKNTINSLNCLYKKGHTIIIFTHRSKKCKKETIKWLKNNNIKHHKLIMNKPKYDLLIDDKSIPPYSYLSGKILEEYSRIIADFKMNFRLPDF